MSAHPMLARRRGLGRNPEPQPEPEYEMVGVVEVPIELHDDLVAAGARQAHVKQFVGGMSWTENLSTSMQQFAAAMATMQRRVETLSRQISITTADVPPPALSPAQRRERDALLRQLAGARNKRDRGRIERRLLALDAA